MRGKEIGDSADCALAPRIWWIDAIRGSAVIGMIIFHFVWDLQSLGLCSEVRFFHYLQLLVAIGFLAISGYCSGISGSSLVRRLIRIVKIGLSAMCITIVSMFLFSNGTVTFGVLHLIATCSFVMAIARENIAICGILGILAFSCYPLTYRYSFDGLGWTILGIRSWHYIAADYFPIVPWAGFLFLSSAVGKIWRPIPTIYKSIPILSWMGRNSLMIYLFHQPVVFTLVWFAGKVLR